jgi:uncharacterized protein with FMN-binding domain
MKRYPVVIGATVAGIAGIMSFHTDNPSRPLSNSLPIAARSGARPSQSGHAPRKAPGGAVPPSTTVPTTAPNNASATGATEQYGYGTLAVTVTVRSSKIVNVQLSDLQTIDGYSQTLAQQVAPTLRRQVLASQSSRIDGISGATYTSQAYALSVQSALDQLHFQ